MLSHDSPYEIDAKAKAKSHEILEQLLGENKKLSDILLNAKDDSAALAGVRDWALTLLEENFDAKLYYQGKKTGRKQLDKLSWRDRAAIRILDYIDNAGREFKDPNLRGAIAKSNPIKRLWMAANQNADVASPYFFEDALHLFRQLNGTEKRNLPSFEKVLSWMQRHPSGLDDHIIELQNKNRERILNILIEKISSGEIETTRFRFDEGMSHEQKFMLASKWWKDAHFHLRFAVRSPDLLNEMLDGSLSLDTMKILHDAEDAGIPFFVNPYYLSLLHVRSSSSNVDLVIRDYVIYSRQLVEEFGHIVAWEKEDEIATDKPNAAGWILPSHYNVHRRYPEVSILIPDTIGRACGGLCSLCQRMYDFQSGRLNFDLDALSPKESWQDKLSRLMKYFENDSQLRDILITGGDALMSSDKSLEKILDAVYEMAKRKVEANKLRADGQKYAEMLRVRLGTRLPVYLPQRITPKLIEVLRTFKEKAVQIGLKQFVIQTHFESPLEITPEAQASVKMFLDAGWIVINQLVFNAAASRRGHTAKLRQDLCSIGVIPYYTFTVKGYMENSHNFATNGRSVQEQAEEKIIGMLPDKHKDALAGLANEAKHVVENINKLTNAAQIPFLATDRNVLNLPGVGKSLSFRVIGITRHGRRILEFEHDASRNHSPIIHQMGKVIIVESKPVGEYMEQLESIGEDLSEYTSLWGYSIGETEPRTPLFEYPKYKFKITDKITNLKLEDQ